MTAGVDAIAIATPVHTHFELALAALQAGKHVWLEKPMTETSAQARQLIDEAQKRNLVLLVDHTFIYTGAVMKMKELIDSGDLGKVLYYDSIRVNLGLFQRDVSVISDLAVHDFSILDYLLGEHPVAVSANGTNHFPGTPENLAYVTLFYDSGTIAHTSVSWLAPVKVRQIHLGGTQEDDHLRRPGAQREDQGLRQGRELHRRPGQDPGDACRLPHRRHVGAQARRHRGAGGRGGALRRLHRQQQGAEDRWATRPAGRRDHRGLPPVDAAQGAAQRRNRQYRIKGESSHDSVRRPESAVPEHQARGQCGDPGHPGQLPVHAGQRSGGLRAGVRRLLPQPSTASA